MRWFKFYGQDFLTDPKMRILTLEEKMCWVVLMCLANAEEKEGDVSFVNEEEVMRQASIDDGSPMWRDTIGFIARFQELDLLAIRNEIVTKSNEIIRYDITLINFDKRQKENLSNAERQQRYRERHKTSSLNIASQQDSNGKVTKSNARIDKNRKEKNIYNNYPQKKSEDRKAKALEEKEFNEVFDNPVDKADAEKERQVEEIERLKRFQLGLKAKGILIALFFFFVFPVHAETISLRYTVSSPLLRPAKVIKLIQAKDHSLPKKPLRPDQPSFGGSVKTNFMEVPDATEWQIISKYPNKNLIAHIYKHESNFGKYDVCRLQGKYNGFGMGETASFHPNCFSSFEAVVKRVNDWIEQFPNKSLAWLTCKYIRGVESENCDTSYRF